MMTKDDAPQWPSEWLRGMLNLCVLRVISRGPTYGYAIAAELEQAGIAAIKGGTLYPLLNRLTTSGLIVERWEPGEAGPGRKFYTLTEAGSAHLETQLAVWHRFADQITHFLTAEQRMRND